MYCQYFFGMDYRRYLFFLRVLACIIQEGKLQYKNHATFPFYSYILCICISILTYYREIHLFLLHPPRPFGQIQGVVRFPVTSVQPLTTSFSFWQDLVLDVPAIGWCHKLDCRNNYFWNLWLTEPFHHSTICQGSENVIIYIIIHPLWNISNRMFFQLV